MLRMIYNTIKYRGILAFIINRNENLVIIEYCNGGVEINHHISLIMFLIRKNYCHFWCRGMWRLYKPPYNSVVWTPKKRYVFFGKHIDNESGFNWPYPHRIF